MSIKWEKVVKIEEIESSSKYVYDFSVPYVENFANMNGIFVHNTVESKLLGWVTETFRFKQFIVIICQPTDTEIMTYNKTDLEPLSLGELPVDNEFTIPAFNLKHGKIEPDIAKILDVGKKYVYEIEFDDGSTERATSEHKFFSIKEGKIVETRVKDIQIGEKILCWKK